MKKYYLTRLSAWILVLTLSLWFGSCGKKSDSVNPGIEGTWQYSGFRIDPALDLLGNGVKTNDLLTLFASSPDEITCFKTTRLTFAAGGKLTETPGQKCTAPPAGTTTAPASLTWKLDGTKLTITGGTGTPDVLDVVISGNTMKLSQTDSNSDYDGDGKKDTVTTTLELTKI